MPRLIDTDKLTYHLAVNDEDQQFFYVKSEDIDEQPTVDAVPVVRCKDCENAKPITIFDKYQLYKCCGDEGAIGYAKVVAPDDYCSCGKRREEND